MPAVGTPYGFGLGPNALTSDTRSRQVVTYPVHDMSGHIVGYVELSDGPACGRDILNSVAIGWPIASVVAALLAAGAGWLASRCITAPLLALTDVTSQMAAGDLSVRADVDRGDELGQLAGSFNEMAEQVEETVAGLRRFVSDASHELHTPLTALHANLELAAGEEDETERQAFIDRALDQLSRMGALSSGLLDLSRLDAGLGSAQPDHSPLNLAQLLRESSELFASRAEQAGLSFALDISEEECIVGGNAGQLRRAISNLLDNAIKFTPAGGQVSAGLECSSDREWAELWVADTGIGIPPDDLPHIFERFHRGRNAAVYAGSGLGLAMVKAIAGAHRGEVTADSTEAGTRFSVRLQTRRVFPNL